MRSMFGKRVFFNHSKKYFPKMFGSLKIKFYSWMYSKAKENGKQVQRNTN